MLASASAAEGESILAASAAEAESESESESGSDTDAEDESMLAEEGRGTLGGSSASGQRERRCCFRHCVCCWEYFPRIHRIAPGKDYVCIPAADAADHSPAWSLLIGVTDGASSLRVSRLRVARSGRILGRPDDALELFHKIVLEKPPGYTFEAGAALAPDGRSLCVLGKDAHEQQLSLLLDTDNKELPLPEIEGTSPCIPISAHDKIWALSATLLDDDIDSFSVVARRLVLEPGGCGKRWEHAGDPFTSQHIFSSFPHWRGSFLQGYAVLPDTNLILVSFEQHGLFLTFAPCSGRWTPVLTDTDETRSQDYLPIFGRGIFVEQHQAVCMLHDNTIYAYKLTYQQDDQKPRLLKLDPPVEIDFVCPFIPEKGYGFLTHLHDRLMCSVWISLAWGDPCPCRNLHAIVTTFHLNDLAQGGITVLHSAHRWLDMVPNPPDQKFCFLQEFKDEGSLVLLQHEEEQEDSSKHVNETSKKLSCCRS
uniref:Uncharacterized protein n=1 Tax=Avena sativa TaxID=4498 RepID=A0ACD5YZ06_AVESA